MSHSKINYRNVVFGGQDKNLSQDSLFYYDPVNHRLTIGNILADAEVNVNGRMYLSQGFSNVFIQGGNYTLTGLGNISIGPFTSESLTTGNYNFCALNESGRYNTTGSYNCTIGYQAFRDGRGNDNIAIGYQAMKNSDVATGNIALGKRVMESITYGGGNIGMGTDSLKSLTGGYGNIGIGAEALEFTTTSLNNIALGVLAVSGTNIAGANIGIGTESLRNIFAGTANIGLGPYSLHSLSTGSNNIAIGNNAGRGLTTQSGYIILGNDPAQNGGVGITPDLLYTEAGQVQFYHYGSGNKSAASLGKTDSGYLFGVATDGTLIELEAQDLAGDNIYTADDTITGNRIVTGADKNLDFTFSTGDFSINNVGSSKAFNINGDDGAVKLGAYGTGATTAASTGLTLSNYIGRYATDGTLLEVSLGEWISFSQADCTDTDYTDEATFTGKMRLTIDNKLHITGIFGHLTLPAGLYTALPASFFTANNIDISSTNTLFTKGQLFTAEGVCNGAASIDSSGLRIQSQGAMTGNEYLNIIIALD